MTKLPRLVASFITTMLLFVFAVGCAEHTPEERIQLQLDEYRTMVMELADTMSQLRDNEITAQEAQSRLGEDFIQQLTDQEMTVRRLIEDERGSIGDETANAFLFKLEEYRKLGRPSVKDDTREITE